MRKHVSRHILAKRQGITEKLKEPVRKSNCYVFCLSTDYSAIVEQIGPSPCGYCGRSNKPECTNAIEKPRKVWAPAKSDCQNFYKYSLESAKKSTTSGPSTNRTIFCALCEKKLPHGRPHPFMKEHMIWSYNMAHHLEAKHPGEEVSPEFEDQFKITEEELLNLKILKSLKPSKALNKRKRNSPEDDESSAGENSDDDLGTKGARTAKSKVAALASKKPKRSKF